ncbi:MAG: hypothetical protein ACYDG2_19635 [Ruminiclostridium sp.]
MLFVKHKKTIISLAAVAVMTLGGVTAFAAASEAALTPVDVDLSKIHGEMIDPSQIKEVGKIDPKILEGLKNAKTAPKLTLTAVPGSVDTSNAQKGEFKIAGKIDPKILDSLKNAKTVPSSSPKLTLTKADMDVTKIDGETVDLFKLKVGKKIDLKTIVGQGYTTAAR